MVGNTLPIDGGESRASLAPNESLTQLQTPLDNSDSDRTELAAIVEGARDAIWSWRLDGTIIRWNSEAQRVFGYTASEMAGRSLLDLVPDDQRADAERIIASLRDGASYRHYETVRLRKDGVRVPVELTISPLRDGSGNMIGASTVCRDITERKQFEAALSKRVGELTTLFDFTARLQTSTSLNDIYEASLHAITRALDADRASILLFDASGRMRFKAWHGLSDGYREAVDGHSPWNSDAINPAPIFVEDILNTEEPEELKQTIAGEGIRGLAFIPLIDSGRLIGKFMTYYRMPHKFTEEEIGVANTIARQLALAIARQLADQDLRESEARFRLMSEHAPVMIWMSDAQGECLHLNQMLRSFWKVDEDNLASFRWSDTMHPEDAPSIVRQMGEALAKRTPVRIKGRYRDSRGGYRILETDARPRFSQLGEFLGMIGVNVDTTEREEAEKARELLVAELNHRVKNTLAVVQGIAHKTFKGSGIPPGPVRAFEDRLVTLSRAHNLLTQANWESASLEQLATLTLDVNGANSERVAIAGPSILLPPKEAVSIAMALHELSTNAIKYGSLSNEAGRVTLEWSKSDGPNPRIELNWTESGGPRVATPTRRGFGSFLLERTLAQDLDGEVTVSFEPEGLTCVIRAPLLELTERQR